MKSMLGKVGAACGREASLGPRRENGLTFEASLQAEDVARANPRIWL